MENLNYLLGSTNKPEFGIRTKWKNGINLIIYLVSQTYTKYNMSCAAPFEVQSPGIFVAFSIVSSSLGAAGRFRLDGSTIIFNYIV